MWGNRRRMRCVAVGGSLAGGWLLLATAPIQCAWAYRFADHWKQEVTEDYDLGAFEHLDA